MPRHARSRGGCLTCKKRKRKCDETRPSCLSCQRRNTECGGYDMICRWNWGIASRGKLAGAVIPVLPPKTQKSRNGNCVDSVEIYHNAQFETPNTGEVRVEKVLAGQSNPVWLRWAQDSVETLTLFSQFLRHGINTLYSTSAQPQFKKMIEDLSQNSRAVFMACVAIQLYENSGGSEEFHLCFEAALNGFRIELIQAAGEIQRSTLCAGLLQCTLSITTSIPWTKHLQCMSDLYCLKDNHWPLNYTTDPIVVHLLEVMGVMDLPNLVLGRQTPSIGLWKQLRQATRSNGGLQGGIEVMSGLPRSLLDILACPMDSAVEERLWFWQQEAGDPLQHLLWDAWRTAGILRSRQDSERSLNQPVRMSSTLPRSTVDLLSDLIKLLESLQQGLERPENQNSLVGNGLLYPFVAASVEVGFLRQHSEWIVALERVGVLCWQKLSPEDTKMVQALFYEALDGVDIVVDFDRAARLQNTEVALF